MTKQLPFLASYGGGHAAIIAQIALGLNDSGIQTHLMGFTTAYQYFIQKGLKANNVCSLIEKRAKEYQDAKDRVENFLPEQRHPDVSLEETLSYFAIGFRDLSIEHGLAMANELIRKSGRVAFEPVATMESYLKEINPSCIVTTTSPRYELALIRAGRKLGIPTIAISDLFLQRERSWVLSGSYADHLCVINQQLKDELIKDGLKNTHVHVTGNPAFDPLFELNFKSDREKLRSELGIKDKIVVLWPSPSVTKADFADRSFATLPEVVAAFEKLLSLNNKFAYIIRPHPNSGHELPRTATHGILDPGLTPEQALSIADVVCFEISTMGLQAHLAGKITVCVGFEDLAVFPKYTGSIVVQNLDEMVSRLLMIDVNLVANNQNAQAPIKSAKNAIIDLIKSYT